MDSTTLQYAACMLLGKLYDQWMRYLDRVYMQYVGACVLWTYGEVV